MMQQRIGLLLGLLLAGGTAPAQFIAGSAGMTILQGTPCSIDSLMLMPGSDLTLADNSLEVSHTAIPGVPLPGIERVYQWSAPFTYSGEAGLYYAMSELNGNSAAQLEVAYNSTAAVTGFTGAGPGTALPGYVSVTLSGISLQQLTAVTAGTGLPVSFLSFEARKTATRTALLQWTTGRERNCSHFIIQRSADGQSFTDLATLSSKALAGNSDVPLYYSGTDKQMMPGANYYRIQQVDKDGNVAYTAVRILHSEGGVLVTLFPNPVKDRLYIRYDGQQKGSLSLDLYDMAGRKLRELRAEYNGPTEVYSLSLEGLPPGMYQLLLQHSGTRQVFKIVRQ